MFMIFVIGVISLGLTYPSLYQPVMLAILFPRVSAFTDEDV